MLRSGVYWKLHTPCCPAHAQAVRMQRGKKINPPVLGCRSELLSTYPCLSLLDSVRLATLRTSLAKILGRRSLALLE